MCVLTGLCCHFCGIARQVITASTLSLLSVVTQYWQLGVLLALYNCFAEVFIVLASSSIARDLKVIMPLTSTAQYQSKLLFAMAIKYVGQFVVEVRG